LVEFFGLLVLWVFLSQSPTDVGQDELKERFYLVVSLQRHTEAPQVFVKGILVSHFAFYCSFTFTFIVTPQV